MQLQTRSEAVSPELDLATVRAAVDFYRLQMRDHALKAVFHSPTVSKALLLEYAGLQYVDSVLWVPMLALMKDRTRNPRLRRALTENILCEAGANHTSHVTLCMQFVRSIGVVPFFGAFDRYSALANHPVEMMNAVSGMSEAQISGWALVAEAIVPDLFRMALPGFRRLPGVDLTYLEEHIVVDADEHATWMFEAAGELLAEGVCVDEILNGIHLGGRTALSVPDALYAKFLRGEYDG